MEPAEIRLAHISDTHIGYSAYRALTEKGENRRSQDFVEAFSRAVNRIVAADPPLIIHSGDVADRPTVSIAHMLLIQRQFARLAGIRPDGSRRQLVVISGNHEEQPHRWKENCFLDLYRNLPGVHIVTGAAKESDPIPYRIVRFDDAGEAGGADPVLANVAVHCLPHRVLAHLADIQAFPLVQPTPGCINILTAHGVAGGSELHKRSVGREYNIPTDVLLRDWDYGALGHWHKQGPVAIAKAGAVWYAGPTENCGFGDALDNGESRGFLDVTIQPGRGVTVTPQPIPIRSMFRLPHIDGTGKTPPELSKELKTNVSLAAQEGTLANAVVGQIVSNVTRDTWSFVDVPAVRVAADAALHYEVSVRPVSAADGTESAQERGLGDIRNVLHEAAATIPTQPRRDAAIALATKLLNRHLAEPVTTEPETELP